MPSLIDYIRELQDFEYERSANAMLSTIAQMSKGQGSEVQALVTALEKKAKAITEASKLVSSEVYSQMLAGFRVEMNKVETLIRQTAPNIELSGARAANNSVTARLFYGTSQDMIEAGLDPTSAEAMAYFMQLVKDVGIPFEVPKPEDLVTKYSQSEEFHNHMDKWGDGYADYFDDAIRNGVREGWSPAKVARYARDMATNIPVNAAYTWTRTLQLQSYRDASARMETLNGRFIEKKIRIAALDGRTCSACIALHGTEVPLGQSIRDHFNGRCDAIYVPAGGEMPEFMQSMSEPGKRQFVEWQNGTDWFDAQSDAYKKQVLGAGRFDLYQQGKFKLDADFVKWHDDDVFGAMPGAKPLWQLEGYGSFREKLINAKGFAAYDYQNYLPELINVYDNELGNRFKNSILNMDYEIRKLEPIDPKHRIAHRLDGSQVIIDDEISLRILNPEGYMPNGSAAVVRRQTIEIIPEYIGTKIQDHEYIHTILYRNNTIDHNLDKYNPPFRFIHATNSKNEQLTMMLTEYHQDRQVWADNLYKMYKYEPGLTPELMLQSVKEVDRFFKGLGLW